MKNRIRYQITACSLGKLLKRGFYMYALKEIFIIITKYSQLCAQPEAIIFRIPDRT